jgi:hypothetical protein
MRTVTLSVVRHPEMTLSLWEVMDVLGRVGVLTVEAARYSPPLKDSLVDFWYDILLSKNT